MNVSFLAVLVAAVALSAGLAPVAARFARRIGAVSPRAGGDQAEGSTPLLGGIAVFVSFAVGAWLMPPVTRELQGIILASGWVLFLGAFQDARPMPKWLWLRLLVPAVAVAILVRSGIVWRWLPPTWWGTSATWALMFLWVVGLARAFRFLDALNGLAIGTAAINSFFIATHAFLTDQKSLLVGSLALMGAACGFLPYNFKPSRRRGKKGSMLGTGGSGSLGLALGSLVVMSDWVDESFKDVLVPALIMAVPVLAMTFTALAALREGPASFLDGWMALPDRTVLGPQGPSLGIRKTELVAVLYLINVCFAMSAFILQSSSAAGVFLVLGQVIILFGIMAYAVMVMGKRRGPPRNTRED